MAGGGGEVGSWRGCLLKKQTHLYTDRFQQRGITARPFTYIQYKNVHSYDKDFPAYINISHHTSDLS